MEETENKEKKKMEKLQKETKLINKCKINK